MKFTGKNTIEGLTLLFLFTLLLFTSCQQRHEPEKSPASAGPESILLKDYSPRSIYDIPVTKVDKAKYPVIDMHSHDYAESKEGLDEWVKTMDETGIEKTVILTIEHGPAFDSLAKVYSKYPGRFELWCGLDYTGYKEPGFADKIIAELVRCHDQGAVGVGELGDKGKGLYYSKPQAIGMHPDDKRMDPVWEKCAELRMPVSIHVADPIWMYEPMDSTNDGLMNAILWRLDNKPDIAGHDEMVDILERTVKNHPNTVFIACHLANCSNDLGKAGALIDKYPNLFMDIGARFGEICAIPRAARRFLVKYQDRIVYGTDLGRSADMYRTTFRLLETSDEHIYIPRYNYHWAFSALELPDSVLEKIYHSNPQKIAEYREGRDITGKR